MSECNKIAKVLGPSIVMPLTGEIDTIKQGREIVAQPKNYLNPGDVVMVTNEKEVIHKFKRFGRPPGLQLEKIKVFRIDGVEGWFLMDNFQLI